MEGLFSCFSSSTTTNTESWPRHISQPVAYRGEAEEAAGMHPPAECHDVLSFQIGACLFDCLQRTRSLVPYACIIPIVSLPASVNQRVWFAPPTIPIGKLEAVGMR